MLREAHEAKNEKFNDKFREKNSNEVRHLVGKTPHVGSVKWLCGLRSYHPDRHEAFSFIDSRYHKKNLVVKNQKAVKSARQKSD